MLYIEYGSKIDEETGRQICQAANGDKDAHWRVYARYRDRIVNYLKRRGVPEDEARDIYIEAFVKIWEKDHYFDGHCR